MITHYEIRRCERQGLDDARGGDFGDARDGDFALRKAGIRRFEGWEFDAVKGGNLAMRGASEPCKECVIGGCRKNFFKLTVAFCEFLLSLTNYEAEFF